MGGEGGVTPSVDVVVVGSGIAGLTFALRMARGVSVLLLTKKERAASNTNWARGGIAAVVGDDDDPALHIADTLVAGAGLCHGDVVASIVREGPARIADLAGWGAAFQREGARYVLGREGGHSRRRIVHAGDRTGRAIESALLDRAATDGLTLLEDHRVVDLVVDANADGGTRVVGVRVVDDRSGVVRDVEAGAVFLATGGCGRVYRHTTNPPVATGDGVAMAFRAGATIANMEFIQFHPTALHPTEDPAFLISEALRGEGAVLRRADGTAFMERHHPLGSLAPRDIVARAIATELARSGDDHVLLDISAIPLALRESRFASTFEGCRLRGIDPADGVPVVPAAHYLCGGVRTDAFGRSSLPGLLAAGEVACTGLHGANRLASNSLLEAVVMAHRAAASLTGEFRKEGRWSDTPRAPAALSEHGWGEGQAADGAQAGGGAQAQAPVAPDPAGPLRQLMWEKAGIVRTVQGLREAREELAFLVRTAAGSELRNLATTAHLIVECALRRRESRGLHWIVDHPGRDNERYLGDTLVTLPAREGAAGARRTWREAR